MVCSQMYLHRFALRGRGAVLAGVAQWIERRPVNQGVAGLIPSQGTCLGERQPHIDFSFPLLSFTSL